MPSSNKELVTSALELCGSLPSPGDWDQKNEAWLRIWSVASDPSVWSTLNNEQAAIVCTTGWKLCMHIHNYKQALVYISAYHARDDIDTADIINLGYLTSMSGLSKLLLVDYEGGLADLRIALNLSKQPDGRFLKKIVRAHICGYLKDLDPNERMPQIMSDLVAELVGIPQGEHSATPSLSTSGHLVEQLMCVRKV